MTQPSWPQELPVDTEVLQRLLARSHRAFSSAVAELDIDIELSSEGVYAPLATWLDGRRPLVRPLVVGINGGQGSGKSTLATLLATLLEVGLDRNVAGFSIDDLYLTRAERGELSRNVHPLLATRGVPGTHDVELGLRVLDDLAGAQADSVTSVPAFDKSRDDRRAHDDWPRHTGRPDIVIFEGWCVGAIAQAEADLVEPVNELERRHDPDGSWRRTVNDQLRGRYRRLFDRLDVLVMMRVPSIEKVIEWRQLQEERLIARAGETARTMTPSQVHEFIMYYERLTRYALTEMPGRADVCLEIDDLHQIANVLARPKTTGPA
ncbi:MAG: hypothetical protein VYE73_13780 [Acidobacteriota bacterium]|nr:hypothetical protein [Acidobacteriota bacterium]